MFLFFEKRWKGTLLLFLFSCTIGFICFHVLYKINVEIRMEKELPQTLRHGISVVIQERGHDTFSTKDFTAFKCKLPGATRNIRIYVDIPGSENKILETIIEGKVINREIHIQNHYNFPVDREEKEVRAFFRKTICYSAIIGLISFIIGICLWSIKIRITWPFVTRLNQYGLSLALSFAVFLIIVACTFFSAIFDYSPIFFTISFSSDSIFADGDCIDILARYHGQEAKEVYRESFFDSDQNLYRQKLLSKTTAKRLIKSNVNEIFIDLYLNSQTKYKIDSVNINGELLSADDFIKYYKKYAVINDGWIQGTSSFVMRTPTDLYQIQRTKIFIKGLFIALCSSVLSFFAFSYIKKYQEGNFILLRNKLEIILGISMLLAFLGLGFLFYCSTKSPAHIDTIVNGISMYNIASGKWDYWSSQFFPAFVSTGAILLYPLGIINRLFHTDAINSPMISMAIMNYLAIVIMLLSMKILLRQSWRSFFIASLFVILFFMGFFPCWFFSQILGEITAGCFLLLGGFILYSSNIPQRLPLFFCGICWAVAYRIKTVTLIPIILMTTIYIVQRFNMNHMFSRRNLIRTKSLTWLLVGFLSILIFYKLFKSSVVKSSDLLWQEYSDQFFLEGPQGLVLPLFNWLNLFNNSFRVSKLVISLYGLTFYVASLLTFIVFVYLLLSRKRFNRYEKFSVCTIVSGLGLFIWFILFSFLTVGAAERHFITGMILAATGSSIYLAQSKNPFSRHACLGLCSAILLLSLSTMQQPWLKESYSEGRGWWTLQFQREKEKEQKYIQAIQYLKDNQLIVKFIQQEFPLKYFFPQGTHVNTAKQYEENMNSLSDEELSNTVVISTGALKDIFQKNYDTLPIYSNDELKIFKYILSDSGI